MPTSQDAQTGSDFAMDALLTERMLAIVIASTDEDGLLNFDWLVMHIWLAMTDSLQSAYATANGYALSGGNGRKRFEASVRRMHLSFKRVLPPALPLMAEFSSTREIMQWRDSAGANRAVSNPLFVRRARAAGIPLSRRDIVYAMAPMVHLAVTHLWRQ
jgi:hypothetical protein